MKVGILEWICGGGLWDIAPAFVSDSLRAEGWSMLSTTANDLAVSGHDVWLAVDPRLVSAQQCDQLRNGCRVVTSTGQQGSLPGAWQEIAGTADATLLIAPELSGALERMSTQLKPISKLLCNSHGEFLTNSCDKWQTALALMRSGLPHPATQLMSEVSRTWLKQPKYSSGRWIVKPRDGAGCEGIRLLTCAEVLSLQEIMLATNTASRWIVQPFIEGPSFSRAAIVGCEGYALWLPLVTQELLFGEKISYQGGRVLQPQSDLFMDLKSSVGLSISQLDKLANLTLSALGPGAFGWIGFDLLYSLCDQQWMVIEANPRLTTSFIGLATAGGAGLMDQLIRACRGQPIARDRNWHSLDFRIK